jgi:iron complex transport system substrate-binding protein
MKARERPGRRPGDDKVPMGLGVPGCGVSRRDRARGGRRRPGAATRWGAWPFGAARLALAALPTLATFATLAAGCRGRAERAGGPPPTASGAAVVDERGQLVRLAREPSRIVSLLPSHTETLFALGAGDRVVARDAFSDRPAAALARPVVAGPAGVNVEAVLALAPDLVVSAEYGEQAGALEDFGLTVWAGSAQSYDEAFPTIDAIGRLVGRAAEAAALNTRLRREIDEAAARVAGLPRVRVYYELDPTPYSVGPRSFVGVLIAKAGGETIVDPALGDFPRLAPEDILARDPEVILGATLDEVRQRPAWSRLAAVRSGRVGVLSADERAAVVRPGPGMAEGVRVLTRRLHPEAFP